MADVVPCAHKGIKKIEIQFSVWEKYVGLYYGVEVQIALLVLFMFSYLAQMFLVCPSVNFEMVFWPAFLLLVISLLAAFNTQTVWSHLVHLGNHPPTSCFSSFSISCHCGVLGVSVGSFVLQCFLRLSVSLDCLPSLPQFHRWKAHVYFPLSPLVHPFHSWRIRSNKTLKPGIPFFSSKLQSSACSNATLCSVLLRGSN